MTQIRTGRRPDGTIYKYPIRKGHRLTKKEKIAGIEKALDNPKTPGHLRPSMEKYLEELKE